MLVGTATFAVDINPEAQMAWDMVEAGYMNAVSVGFIPHRVEYDEVMDAFVLYDNELMECSLVGIGSNRQALAKEKETTEPVIDAVIKARDVLDEQIKAYENMRTLSKLKALGFLQKAVRQLKI